MVSREQILDAANALAPVLRERARDTELLRRVPDETIRDLQDAGLFKVLQPASYGGYETDMATYFDVVMTLSAADGSVGWVYSVLSVQTWALSLMDPLAGKEVWGSEPRALMSSAVAPRSGFIDKTAQGYRIDGQFGFSSGCHHASWVFILGVPRNAPEEGMCEFLVPRSDLEILDTWNVMGLCGTGSCDVRVESDVPAHRVHRLASQTPQLSDAPVYKVPFMTIFPHAAVVPMVGMAQGAVEDYLSYQKDRVNLLGSKVAHETGTQIRVAESTANLDTARLSLSRSCNDLMKAAKEGVFSPDLLARVDRDRVLATRHSVDAVNRIFATAGARALSLDNSIQRAWRDVHAGAAHPASLTDPALAAYGAQAFGIEATPIH